VVGVNQDGTAAANRFGSERAEALSALRPKKLPVTRRVFLIK